MNHEERVVRIHLIPLLIGFVLLGALSHSVQLHFTKAADAAMPPAEQAALPQRLSAVSNEMGDELETGLPSTAVIAPVPLFIRGEGFDRCAAAVPAGGGQYVCSWAL
jgi:hypothetical protein